VVRWYGERNDERTTYHDDDRTTYRRRSSVGVGPGGRLRTTVRRRSSVGRTERNGRDVRTTSNGRVRPDGPEVYARAVRIS